MFNISRSYPNDRGKRDFSSESTDNDQREVLSQRYWTGYHSLFCLF